MTAVDGARFERLRTATIGQMREIPSVAAEQFGVLTRGQALPSGWTDPALRHAVRIGQLDRPRPAVFAVPADENDPDRHVVAATRRAIGAALTHRDAVVSCTASTRWHGSPVVVRRPPSCLTVPPGGRRDAVGAHLHRARLDRDEILRGGAALLTAVPRTIVDVAREHGTLAALVVADAAVHRDLLTVDDLAAAVRRDAGIPYVGRAHDLARLVDGRAESPLETMSRWEIRRAGLPPPTLQQIVLGEWGGFVARVDFGWDEFGVVGEADGEGKQQTVAELRAQGDRDRLLRELGLQVVRWGPTDLRPFTGVAGRLRAAFARGIPPDGARRWRISTRHELAR